MGVDHEGGDAKGCDGEPKVDEMGDPDGHRHVEEDQQIPEAHVDTGASETGVKDAEGYTRRRETTASGNVSGASEGQIAEDGVGVDLGREDFEDGGE